MAFSTGREGFELEARIHYLLHEIVTIFRESEIKKAYNDNSLNGVDHLVLGGNIMISIQDKWKNSVGQQEMSQFLDCTSRLVKKVPEITRVHTILVTRTRPTANALKTLEEKRTVILQCDDMKMLSMMCALKVLDILQINADRLINKSPYCRRIVIMSEEGIGQLERIKAKTPVAHHEIFKRYLRAESGLFDENEFNFEIYNTRT